LSGKIFLLSAFFAFCLPLEARYKPWDCDVLTGDELYHSAAGNKRTHVYNGAQGGAFFLVRFFQVFISPQDGPNCRHVPVCSVYARRAVLMHGAFIGSILAGDRLLRCNPFYPPSRDPVPERPFQR